MAAPLALASSTPSGSPAAADQPLPLPLRAPDAITPRGASMSPPRDGSPLASAIPSRTEWKRTLRTWYFGDSSASNSRITCSSASTCGSRFGSLGHDRMPPALDGPVSCRTGTSAAKCCRSRCDPWLSRGAGRGASRVGVKLVGEKADQKVLLVVTKVLERAARDTSIRSKGIALARAFCESLRGKRSAANDQGPAHHAASCPLQSPCHNARSDGQRSY